MRLDIKQIVHQAEISKLKYKFTNMKLDKPTRLLVKGDQDVPAEMEEEIVVNQPVRRNTGPRFRS